MNSGLIPGLIAGPNRLSKAVLSRKQSIPGAEITQALANLGIARVSLSAPVTRTSTATPSNTGLEALNVSLLPSSRYRVTYRLYTLGGNPGAKLAINYPSSLPEINATIIGYSFMSGFAGEVSKDFYAYYPPGTIIIEGATDDPEEVNLNLTLDILTGSTANTYGTISPLFSQALSSATATSMSQCSCVEVLKFS